MTRWMVAFDGSHDSEIAANTAFHLMDMQKDELVLFTVFENVMQPWVFPYGTSAIPILLETQRNMENDLKKKASEMLHKCKEKGVEKCTALVRNGNHSGETICEAAQDMEVDVLIMGRKSVGAIERIMVGSCSKYLVFFYCLLVQVLCGTCSM